MGTGYTRNDTANNIADGNIINASDLDGEFDAVQSAFNASTGHTHDGTAGEGAPIETIGPSQDVVATASVLRPKTDNTVDLGTTSLEYKDLFLDGTAHIDTLDVDENASITGTLGVTAATTLSSTLGVTGAATLSSTLGVTGATTLSSTLGVTGAATLSSTLAVTGATGIDGDFDINTNKFTVASATGNTAVAGTLGVTGATTATGGLNVDTISEITSANGVVIDGVTLKDGGATVTADINFGDNVDANFGADSDLKIFHDAGGTSHIRESGSSHLYIEATNLRLKSSADTGETYLTADFDGAVSLYYDNAIKLATTSTGVDITGTLTSDGLTSTGSGANTTYFTGGDDSIAGRQLTLSSEANGGQNNATHRLTVPSGYGSFNVSVNSAERLKIDNNGDISFYDSLGSSQSFFWNASAEYLSVGGTTGTFAPINYIGSNGRLGINDGNTSGGTKIQSFATTNANGYLAFEGWDKEYMRIDSSGNVGIGTTSPSDLLDISAVGTSAMRLSDSSTPATYGQITQANGVLTFAADAGNAQTGSNIQFEVDGSEAMRIDSSGNVGIGTSSPDGNLHVYEDSTAGSYIFLENTDGSTRFQANNDSLFIDAETHIFRDSVAGGSGEYMRIDSSGNLLVGTTDTDPTGNNVVGTKLNGQARFSVSGGPAAEFNRIGSDAEILRFRKDGAEVGSIGTSGGRMTVGSGSSASGIRFDGAQWIPTISDAASDNGVDIGWTDSRIRNIYLSGGVIFGDAGGSGTSTSNTLDSYEEGTWTPVITPEGGSAAGITVNHATYTKVGRLVSLVFDVTINSISGTSSSNAIELTGMPFNSTTSGGGGPNIAYGNLTASMTGTLALSGNTTSKYRIVNLDGTTALNASDHLQATSRLEGQFTYHTT